MKQITCKATTTQCDMYGTPLHKTTLEINSYPYMLYMKYK